MNSAAAPSRPQKASPVKRTILYIEDHAVTRRLVEQMLLRLRPHIELHLAANARDGIKAAIDKRPALILLDNRLPDATAGEVLRQLASAEVTTGIPVIVISGDSAKTGDELLAIGASAFLTKPFDIDRLVTLIDRYIH
jgi:two-component system, chemotaxis family, chemotaxis protein CheY